MKPLSFFGRFRKAIVSCSSDSFVQKITQQLDGSCKVRSDSQLLLNILQKTAFLFVQTQNKYIVSKGYCLAHHDAKKCFLTICLYHILSLGNLEELLQNLETLCFTYEQWTVSIYCSSTDSVETLLSRVAKCLINFNEQSVLTKEIDDWTEFPVSQKKRFLRKKFRENFFELLQ